MPSRIAQFECIRTLGDGATAKVKLAVGPDGKNVAIKIFNTGLSPKMQQALYAEIETMEKLKHPNIVNQIGFQR